MYIWIDRVKAFFDIKRHIITKHQIGSSTQIETEMERLKYHLSLE